MLRGRKHSIPDLIALTKEEMELGSPGEFAGYGLLEPTGPYTELLSELGSVFVDLFNLRIISNEDIRELRQLLLLCQNSPHRQS
jgi:hypothetical protein